MSKTATSGITAYFNIPTLTQLRSCRLIFNQHIPYIGNEIRTLNVPECLFNYAHYVHVAEKLKSFWCTSSCKQSAATSQILAGSLEVNGWLSQLYSITQASQEDNMRTNVPSLVLKLTQSTLFMATPKQQTTAPLGSFHTQCTFSLCGLNSLGGLWYPWKLSTIY